jgi:hypothetical protein
MAAATVRRRHQRPARALTPPALSAARAALADYAHDHDIALLFLDPPEVFDAAIVGLVYGFGQEPAVLYDEEKCLAGLMAGGLDEDAAREWFEFNTIGAWLGEATPRFLLRPPPASP